MAHSATATPEEGSRAEDSVSKMEAGGSIWSKISHFKRDKKSDGKSYKKEKKVSVASQHFFFFLT
jgi:hypothetical protein